MEVKDEQIERLVKLVDMQADVIEAQQKMIELLELENTTEHQV